MLKFGCSTVALANLLLSRRPSVNGLSVKGDLVVNQNNSGGGFAAQVFTSYHIFAEFAP